MSHADVCRQLDELETFLRVVFDSPRYKSLDNENKAMVLSDLSNHGEYHPITYLR
jgi:hypothetical protein